MTKQDTAKVLAILKAVYPHSFKDMTERDTATLLNLWQRIFAEDDASEVSAAVDALIASRTTGFSPTPGEVKEQLYKLKTVDKFDDISAWALVSKACQNGLYGYKTEFEKLPEAVQKAVGAPEQLKAWAMMDADTVESVVASNFMKNYRAIQQREKDLAMLPPSVKDLLADTAEKMKLADQKQIEAPKKEKLLPLPLEPMITAHHEEQKPVPTDYKTPDEDTWEKRREQAMQKLNGVLR